MINLDKAMKINLKLRILGVCFGHQAIAQFYGSKIEKTGRKGGIEKIQLN